MEFPTEVLDQVLSYLTLRDRKSVSLVCESWSEIAFNSFYMKHVRLCIDSTWDQSIVDCLRNSSRRYRNVFIYLWTNSLSEMNFDMIVEILDLFGGALKRFHSLTRLTEEQLWNVMVRVPDIRELIVTVDASFLKYDRSVPVLKCLQDSSNNVPLELFQPDTKSSTSQYAIKLVEVPRTCEMPSDECHFSVENLRFPMLEALKLTTWGNCAKNDKALRLFFNGVQYLKDVRLDFYVNDLFLDVLTQTCSGIENLELKLRNPNSDTFQQLERLKKLKILSIFAYSYRQMPLQGKPLLSVKKFSFNLIMEDNEEKIFQGFRQLLPSVDDISIRLERNGNLINACQYFPELRRLTIADDLTRGHMKSANFFKNFGNLGQLEELTLKSIYVQSECMPPIRHLKRLKLQLFVWLTDNDMATLAKLYPQLKYLELFWCAKVSSGAIEEFCSRLPDCVVECVQYG
ncbi:hypothetical protein RP20_CCG001611 [Aedes albopictus]|nr:hypothetical protein RP20_CCG001611 [Aedes albopictus]